MDAHISGSICKALKQGTLVCSTLLTPNSKMSCGGSMHGKLTQTPRSMMFVGCCLA